MNIVKNRKIFYIFSGILVALSITLVSVFGLKFGIDFTGGSILEIQYSDAESMPEQSQVEGVVNSFDLGETLIRQTGDLGYLIKTPTINEEVKNSIVSGLDSLAEIDPVASETEISDQSQVLGQNQTSLEVLRFNTVGPTLGSELKNKSSVAILLVLLAIIFFVAYVFRAISKPVSSWKYGLVTIIALAHDIILTVGFFALMGYFLGTEVNTLFVVAILVILGYSVNDSIVVLDRVRENLKDKDEKVRLARFDEIAGESLNQTFSRSINTSLTTLLALVALYIWGADATKDFALALIVGIVSGTYSSIFLAVPMLVSFKNRQAKKGIK